MPLSSAFVGLALIATFGSTVGYLLSWRSVTLVLDCQISLFLSLPSTSILVRGGDYSSGIIGCAATGATSLQLFRFDAQGIRNVIPAPVVPIPNGFVLTLSDSNVGVDTAGLYQCEAKNNSATTKRENATIYVDGIVFKKVHFQRNILFCN